MDPPACVQNAMMTKDKKPFTYTPGGIDLSEVRSPRMARRIERNANLGGVEDIPRAGPQSAQDYSNLPPSTLAAMRPQPQVQVFPSGPPPPTSMKNRGAPPPPPMNIPPPPPPPSAPLPTQKVRMSDNQVLERPDMTKIIPEEPMRLLRKTGGPQPRKSIVDQMFEEARGQPQAPRSPQYEQPEQRYQPSVVERGAPVSPVPKQQYQPQPYQPPSPKQPPTLSHRSPEHVKEQPRYQPPVIERQPTTPPHVNAKPEVKTSTAHLGSLYIPPPNQQQQQQQQRHVVSPPTPPERNHDSPNLQTPPLKEAPKPWQTKKPQQEELPPWAKKDGAMQQQQQQQQSPPLPVQEQRWLQSRPVQQPNQQQPVGVRIEIRTGPNAAYEEADDRNPNAVYVTQPLVLQHPGPKGTVQQKQIPPKPKVDNQGARIIPIKIEGSNEPRTPERSLNRQQSWGNNPSQSNSFKIIQKITNTDENDDDVNTPITEHPPMYPQNFQQPPEQLRRMKVNDGSQNMANRFDQVSRGSVADGNRGPQVRTIPVTIEDDGAPQPYVHPSEQVVPEPKKYMGSSIPSRSFKILQAMTAPDNSASVDEQNEASPYEQWGYDPYFPHYTPPPYWQDYYYNYYYPDPYAGLSRSENPPKTKSGRQMPPHTNRQTPVNSGRRTPTSERQTPTSGRQTPTPGRQTPTGWQTPEPVLRPPRYTPIPFWGYMPPPYPYVASRSGSTTEESDTETLTNPRSIPLPFWNQQWSEEFIEDNTKTKGYSRHPPYYDPYYCHCYYGYPPMYPPYSYNEPDDFTGYSSTEEMAFYNNTARQQTVVTPTLCVKEQVTNTSQNTIEPESEDMSDSEGDTETEDDNKETQNFNSLKSIKSVNNITVYYAEENRASEVEECIDEVSDESNEETDEESLAEEDDYPHQLSVIYEESERTESRLRSASAMSDTTTIAEEKTDDEDEPRQAPTSLPFKVTVTVTEEEKDDVKTIVVENGELRSFNIIQEESEENIKKTDDNTEKQTDEGKESDESEDWWGILGKEDDLPEPKKINIREQDEETEDTKDIEKQNKHVQIELINTKTNRRSIYDEFDESEEENNGKIIEMGSFVAELEQIQKESGLWNIDLKDKKNTQENLQIKDAASKPIETDNESEEIDFWSTLNKDEDDIKPRRKNSTSYSEYNSSMSSKRNDNDKKEIQITHESEESEDETDSSSSSEEEENAKGNVSNNDTEVKVLSIKERIQALKENTKQKQTKTHHEEEIKIHIKEKITALEIAGQSRSKTTSTKSSLKSFEEYSEEEDFDSGVTSDMSRHISDTEEFPELKKLTRYQRAATHSRLFKLLQDECDDEEEEEIEEKPSTLSVQQHTETPRRDQLSLPLSKSPEPLSVSSSGVSSPNSPVNEKLVSELVQSLLKRKKGQIFRNVPKEKLFAAAARILQEDLDCYEIEDCSSFLSPLRSSTGYSTAAETPQEFHSSYDEYKQYYESWNEADNEKLSDENYEILPSKAFKLLQEHSSQNKTGTIAGLLAKCPRVLSSKNIHKKLMKLLESSECSPPAPDKPPESNEVTTAS